jgi:AP-1 complex subunit gamma-1
MSMRMRDLIKAVRSCKTAAEERAVIAKECANIRTSIAADDNENRQRNVVSGCLTSRDSSVRRKS